GVRIQAVTDEIAESLGLDKARGALVASVSDPGPAQAAGIQPGDVILTFNDKPVADMRHLPRLVAGTPGDKVVPVTVWRKRQNASLNVKVGKLQETQTASANAETPAKPTVPKVDGETVKALGMTLSNVTPDLKQKFSLAEAAKGVVVVDVQ